MNELLSDVRFWFTTMGLGLLAFVKYLWNRQEKRLDKIEADMVRRDEFDRLRADFQSKHNENGQRMDTGFGEIKKLMREDTDKAELHREKMRTSLEVLRIDVAVIKGEGLFDDAGRVRR